MRITTTTAALVGALLLAACGGAAEPAATTGATGPTDTAPTEDAMTEDRTGSARTGSESTATAGETAATTTAEVGVGSTDLGDVLVDGDGMTLYVFDADDVDTSTCTEGCLDAWPPVLATDVSAGEGVTGELGTFTRDDGDVQVSVGGRPLYRYATDAEPGETAGQGVGGAWWVVDPAGTAVTGAGGDATDGATTESGGIYGGLGS